MRAAEDSAARLGREEAFKQVVAFLDYLKADPARKQQLTAQLAARARQDPLYATVAREIQILAAGAGLGASASPFKLLGTVSSVASGRVVVEPLVDLAVKAGARVQIRRASGLASDVLVARGIVQQAGAGGITVLLDASGKAAPGGHGCGVRRDRRLSGMPLLSFALAVVPALFLVRYYYRQDRARPEPKGLVVKVFLFGVLSALVAVPLELLVGQFQRAFDPRSIWYPCSRPSSWPGWSRST